MRTIRIILSKWKNFLQSNGLKGRIPSNRDELAHLATGYRRLGTMVDRVLLATPSLHTSVHGNPPIAKELIVHFGIFKTGSTSIQKTLFDHSKNLQNCSYIHGGTPNSSLMVRYTAQNFKQLERLYGTDLGRMGIEKRQRHWRKAFFEAMTKGRYRSDRLILSAEIITGFTKFDLDCFAEYIVPHAERVQFFGYMRESVLLARPNFLSNRSTTLYMFDERPKRSSEPFEPGKLVLSVSWNIDRASDTGSRMYPKN